MSQPNPSPIEDTFVAAMLRAMQHSGLHPDRTGVRRAVGEAIDAWPGTPRDRWRKWLAETASILGLPFRSLTVTAREAIDIVQTGGLLLVLAENGEDLTWVHLDGRRVVCECFQSDGTATRPQKLTARRLRNMVVTNEDDRIDVLVLEPSLRMSSGDHLKPLDRLKAIMRPEWSDIWIVLVFAVIVGIMSIATPIAVESLVNTVAFGRYLQPVAILAIILFAFLSFSAAMKALQTYVVELIQRRLFVRLAGELGHRLPRVKSEAWDEEYGPESVNRFFDVLTIQKVAAGLLLDALSLVLGAAVGMAVLAVYHPYLLGFNIILLAMILAVVFVIGRGGVKSAIKESKQKYYMAEWLEDLTRCPQAFRQRGSLDYAVERTDLLSSDYLTAREKHFRILFRQILFVLAIQALASTALLGLGGMLVINQQLTLGQLVAAELIVATVVGAFAKLGKHIEGYYDLLAAVDKVGHLLDLPTEREDGIQAIDNDNAMAVGSMNASYRYPSGPAGLRDITFELHPGERIGIVGGTGSGKTTLGEVMYGLRSISGGQMELDGVAPRDLRPSVLRQHVALASKVEIFHGTVAANVHLERPGISLSDVRQALERVGLIEKVQILKSGIDTVLTQNGNPLSQTEQVLLMIARAIAGQPRLLIIDCLLDVLADEPRNELLETLAGDHANWTLIVLTSRPSIAEALPRQAVLEAGILSDPTSIPAQTV